MQATETIMAVNFFGAVRVSQAFIPLLRYAKNSRIVNISSILSFAGLPSTAAYSASKAALRYWSEAQRLELLKYDIQVVTICPDFFKTDMTATLNILKTFDREIEKLPESVREAYGEEYLNNQRMLLTDKDSIVMTNEDTSPVIKAIADGVLQFRPDPVLVPSSFFSKLFKAIMSSSFLPQIISDWILMTLGQQDRIPTKWSTRPVQISEETGEETFIRDTE